MRIYIITFLMLFSALFAESPYYMHGEKKVYLTPIDYNSKALRASTYSSTPMQYYQHNKIVVGVADTLLFKLKESKDLQEILQSYGLTLEKEIDTNLYLAKVADTSKILEIANTLHVDTRVLFAHPNFYKESTKR